MAVYVEKVSSDPPRGVVYWQDETFIDPRFQALRVVAADECVYIIKGGITARSLRNFSKHYLPWFAALWMLLAAVFGTCVIPNRLLQQIWPGDEACLHHCSMTL
jgi:hypothetical protein